jgi:hypothetical protein
MVCHVSVNMISSSVVLSNRRRPWHREREAGTCFSPLAAIDAADDASHAAIRSIGPYCVLEPISVTCAEMESTMGVSSVLPMGTTCASFTLS